MSSDTQKALTQLKPELRQRLEKISLIVSDIDGVLTDGKLYLGNEGEIKIFSIRDSFRVEVAIQQGFPVIWFTGRKVPTVEDRAKELGVRVWYKKDVGETLFAKLKEEYDVDPEQVLYIGDDWNDLYFMGHVGFAVAPANAQEENKECAHFITSARGGEGVLSEVIELLLRAKGSWDRTVHDYREKFIF